MNDGKILTALERFGAMFPWDKVAIWLEREPDGNVSFVAYINSDYARGAQSACGSGDSLEEAINRCQADAGMRDPEKHRETMIRELKEKIEKLEAADFSMPPYRSGYHLAAGALNLSIDVESTKQSPPF